MFRCEIPQPIHASVQAPPRYREASQEESTTPFSIYVDEQIDSIAHPQPTRAKSDNTSPRSRRKHISLDEKRLMGDYRAPRDAVPLTIPGASEDVMHVRGNYHKPRGPNFQPRNTLNSSHPAAPQRTPRSQGYGKKASHAFYPAPLTLEMHRGNNVHRPQTLQHDFPERDDQPAKRRKTQGHPIAGPSTSSPVINVLDSDDEAPPAERIKNRTVRRNDPDAVSPTLKRSQPSHASSRKTVLESFGRQSEFRDVDARVDPRPAKKQRVTVFERNMEKPAQAVSKTSVSAKQAPQPSPIIVDDDQSQSNNRPTDLASALLGVLESEDRHRAGNGNKEKPPDTSFVSPYFVENTANNTERKPTEARTPSTNGKLRRPKQLDRERSSPSYSVNGPTKTAVGLARAAMEEAADDSFDELQGGVTIRSPSVAARPLMQEGYRRTRSPRKQQTNGLSAPPTPAPDTIRSPSDIPRTEFVRSKPSVAEPSAGAKPMNRRKKEPDHPTWPLSVYSADIFKSRDEDLLLHWDTNRQRGYITVNGQTPREEDTAACIYPEKIQKYVRGPPGCTQVRLLGSTSQNGSFSRDLAFAKPSGFREFMSILDDATKGTLKEIVKSVDDMDKYFAKIVAQPSRSNEGTGAPIDEGDEIALLERRVHRDAKGAKEPDAREPGPPQPAKRSLISQMRVDAQDQKSASRPSKPNPGSARIDDVVAGLTGSQKKILDKANKLYGSAATRSSTRTATSKAPTKPQKSPSPSLSFVPNEEKYSLAHGLGQKWDQPVVFSLTGRKRAVVDFEDLERLDDGEFLNDNIISFYILLKEHEARQRGLAEKAVYSFNTYFYSQLTNTQKGQRGINYGAVERWTAKDDLFNYDYIIVPVNEDAHWYVAIICNLPNINRVLHTGPKEDDVSPAKIVQAEETNSRLVTTASSPAKDQTIDEPSSHNRPQRTDVLENGISQMSIHSDNIDNEAKRGGHDSALATAKIAGPTGEDSTEWPDPAENEPPRASSPLKSEEVIEVDKSAKQAPTKKIPPRKRQPVLRKYSPEDPVIIILDSLGVAHARTARNLKEYVIAEGKAKRSLDISLNDIQAMTAKDIPLQDNFCDCGLFLLGYVEKFLQNPAEFVRKVLTRDMDADKDWPEMDPRNMRHAIRDILQEEYKKQAEARKAEKEKRRTELKRKKREQKAKETADQVTSAQAEPGQQSSVPTEPEEPESTRAMPAQPASNVHPQVVIIQSESPEARKQHVARKSQMVKAPKTPQVEVRTKPEDEDLAAEHQIIHDSYDYEMLDQPQKPLVEHEESVIEIADSQPVQRGQISPDLSFPGQLKPVKTGDHHRRKRSLEL